ncbi:thioredoxin family protein [Sediminitomix flava]|uniref:Thioredoxin-like protein n=1 Tax=Sediminitomix flava TaxID=379075 RepID=A0A315ZBF7_SEDFL|nr:thioredoxin family protein [Sediminitomix flava]PWJ42916.1 thioredoxin-like protein [Sediminitomix flava]
MSTEIKILHSSCCSKNSPIRSQIEAVAKAKGIEVNIQELSDIQETMAYGAMSFPSIVVNGKLYDYKKLSSDDQLAAIL